VRRLRKDERKFRDEGCGGHLGEKPPFAWPLGLGKKDFNAFLLMSRKAGASSRVGTGMPEAPSDIT
jgi:hypothetical protein